MVAAPPRLAPARGPGRGATLSPTHPIHPTNPAAPIPFPTLPGSIRAGHRRLFLRFSSLRKVSLPSSHRMPTPPSSQDLHPVLVHRLGNRHPCRRGISPARVPCLAGIRPHRRHRGGLRSPRTCQFRHRPHLTRLGMQRHGPWPVPRHRLRRRAQRARRVE